MKSHVCSICGKEFDSPLSLGGHISSHNRGESYKKKRETQRSRDKRKNLHFPKKCKFCNLEFENGFSLGGHLISCGLNPNSKETYLRISEKAKGRILSESHKKAISASMKKAHEDGKAWNIGMSRWNNKKSYPELFFSRVIENEFSDKNYISEFPLHIYSIDFAWPKIKKGIEIDGSQHKRFEDYSERDKRKDLYAKENGWEILRISWDDLFSQTKHWIKIAYDFIH